MNAVNAGIEDEKVNEGIEDEKVSVKVTEDNHQLNDKLDLLLTQVQEIVGSLNKKDLKNKDCDSENKGNEPEADIQEVESILRLLKIARSITDLEELGFKYYEDESLLRCTLCADDENKSHETHSQAVGVFSYNKVYERDFSDKDFAPEFKNLKRTVKSHLVRTTHLNQLKNQREKEEEERKRMNKNVEAGMNLGRHCMKNYNLGRPYTDYESDVLNTKLSGGFVGDLHHSRKFPAEFRPFVDRVVTRRVVKFISTPMKQTGHLPPVAISADKGTYKHRSRQFLMCSVINPGGENLIEVISCGQPVVEGGSKGKDLMENMKTGYDKHGIKGIQIKSAVFDGVYLHCSIADHFNEIYDIEPGTVLFSWDGLHKCGLVDKHISKRAEFVWLVNDTDTCQQLFTMFNWGASYEKFLQATLLWKLSKVNLASFSETRFANSRRKVYFNIHHSFAPIISCLDANILEESRINISNAKEDKDVAAKVRDKARTSREVKGKIMNVRFQLTLSSLADIYDQFGKVVNTAQEVHLLPHERIDRYFEAVEEMKLMEKCLAHHEDCHICKPNSDPKTVCLWKLNHADKDSLKKSKSIRGLPVIDQHEEKGKNIFYTMYLMYK